MSSSFRIYSMQRVRSSFDVTARRFHLLTRKCHLTSSHSTNLYEIIFASLKIINRKHGWRSLWSAVTMLERSNLGCNAINTKLIYLSILVGGRHRGTYRPPKQDRSKGLKFWSCLYQLPNKHSFSGGTSMFSVVLFVQKAMPQGLPFSTDNIINWYIVVR